DAAQPIPPTTAATFVACSIPATTTRLTICNLVCSAANAVSSWTDSTSSTTSRESHKRNASAGSGDLIHTHQYQVQMQFEKISSFMDRMDLRLTRLEKIAADILAAQKEGDVNLVNRIEYESMKKMYIFLLLFSSCLQARTNGI